MAYLKSIEKSKNIPQIVIDITAGNLSAMEVYYKNKQHSINKGFELEDLWGDRWVISPLNLALRYNNFPSVKWLVEHGANLNVEHDFSILTAVRYCNEDIIRYLVENGAKLLDTSKRRHDTNPYTEALRGKKLKNLPVIHELGYTVEEFGGTAFRGEVLNRNYKALEFFVAHGVDVNYSKADMIFPRHETALHTATICGDLKMCKFLVKHGADITLTDKNGMRPYNIAVEQRHIALIEYFKSLEDDMMFDLEYKLLELEAYKLPDSLIEFLQGEQLRVHSNKNCDVAFVDFFSLIDTVSLEIDGQYYLRISKEVHAYETVHVLWNPRTKQIALYDEEHNELKDVASFDDFIKNVGKYMEKFIFGD